MIDESPPPEIAHFCVKLFDENENMIYKNVEDFSRALKCPVDTSVKVVSIVGNTGDGKSHTLNHAFFEGDEVFPTCKTQSPCTLGVASAYLPDKKLIFLDTEGLLGSSQNPNKQKRLLLKVIAISDIIIYRIMSNRLHSDMFTFLADASDAFDVHFKGDLKKICESHNLPYSLLGPDVIVFQETRHTKPLDENTEKIILLDRVRSINRNVDSFASLNYIGSQILEGETDFEPLSNLVYSLVQENRTRSPRRLKHIFNMLANLNDHFASELPANSEMTFVQEYFTCPARCLSCQARCCLGLGHEKSDNTKHMAEPHHICRYEESLQNKIYLCKICMADGKETILTPKAFGQSDDTVTGIIKFIWHGFILECHRHNLVYKSRAQWSNNLVPEKTPKVDWRVIHLWPGETSPLRGIHNAGQHVIDKITYVTSNVSDFAKPHVRVVGEHLTDYVAPDYWQPNSHITECYCCGKSFNDIGSSASLKGNSMQQNNSAIPSDLDDDGCKHHCRACGMGVCHSCSTARMQVPEHGYGDEMVRVCNKCFQKRKNNMSRQSDAVMSQCDSNVQKANPTGRKLVEYMAITKNIISPFFNAPKEIVKSYVRPDYWQPDEECESCPCCYQIFSNSRPIHHCRKCGKGVCNDCSLNNSPVLERGIDEPARVCDICFLGKEKVQKKRDQNTKNDESIFDTMNDFGFTTVALTVPNNDKNDGSDLEKESTTQQKQVPGIRTIKHNPQQTRGKSGKKIDGAKKMNY